MTSRPVYGANNSIIRYELLDGEIVDVLRTRLNFTPIFTQIDNTSWGYQLPSGNFTGGLYCIENELVDLMANTYPMSDHNTTKSLFLKPITRGRLYFIVPTPEIIRELMVSLYNSIGRTF